MKRDIVLPTRNGPLGGELDIPATPRGLVFIALPDRYAFDPAWGADLANREYAVLAMPLLGPAEAGFPDYQLNVPLMTQRLVDALAQVRFDEDAGPLPLALFAMGPTTPAAVRAAARRDAQVRSLACHGGIVDRAGRQNLDLLAAPLLMVLDAEDASAASSFQRASPYLSAPHRLMTLEPDGEPFDHVTRWFEEHFEAI